MKSTISNRRVLFGSGIGVAIILAIALAFATAATGGAPSPSAEIGKLKRQVATLKKEVRATKAQSSFISVSSRIAFIDAAGIHGMEASFATAGLTARNIEAMTNVITVTSKLAWPAALSADAKTVAAKCQATLDAWKAGNRQEAGAQLKAAHDAYHALVASGYLWLAERST